MLTTQERLNRARAEIMINSLQSTSTHSIDALRYFLNSNHIRPDGCYISCDFAAHPEGGSYSSKPDMLSDHLILRKQ